MFLCLCQGHVKCWCLLLWYCICEYLPAYCHLSSLPFFCLFLFYSYIVHSLLCWAHNGSIISLLWQEVWCAVAFGMTCNVRAVAAAKLLRGRLRGCLHSSSVFTPLLSRLSIINTTVVCQLALMSLAPSTMCCIMCCPLLP